jgi:hypothetical protein
VLADRNEFFKAMLLGPWAKEKCTEEDPILITDTPYHIFYSVYPRTPTSTPTPSREGD